MQPKLLPSFVGKPPNQQKVEVWAQFLPELISFEQLKRLNNDPLMAGRTWIGEEAAPILTLLLAAPHFVGSLQFGLASLMQNGYFVAEDQAFCAWLDQLLPVIREELSEVLVNQAVPDSGERILANLERSKGRLWPPRLGPVIRRCKNRLWIDLYAATSVLDSLLEFPLTAGDTVANARAEHFEDAVQRAINSSKWQPSPGLRDLARRELRVRGRAISDIDALGARNKRLVLVSCKSLIYSAAYDTGDHHRVRNAASTVVDGVAHWQAVVGSLRENPVGDNYDFSGYDDLIPVLCTPHPVYVPVGIATAELRPGLHAAVSVEELVSWLKDND